MNNELKKLTIINQEAETKCQVKYIPKRFLSRERQPYGKGVLGNKVLGIKEYPECAWMSMNELLFIQYFRTIQDKKAEIILKLS